MITAIVRTKLLATSGITSLVSTRVYIDALPQPNPTLPAITIHPVSEVPSKTAGKGTEARVQISCWSNPPVSAGLRSPAEAESVAAAVKAAMHKPRLNTAPEQWTTGSTKYNIITRYCTGGVRVIADPSGYYHIPVDVQISYQEV